LSPHSHQALRDRAEIFDLVRVTPRGLDRLFVENIRNWERSVSDTARNFLIGCAETAATAWAKKDPGIWEGSMRLGRSPKPSGGEPGPDHALAAAEEGSGRVGGRAAQYRIRLARPDEMLRLREIENWAGTMLSGLGLIEDALDVAFPPEDL